MKATLDQLLKSHGALWRGSGLHSGQDALSTGFAALDEALPGRGWGIGQLNELLPRRRGIGELSLLLPALQQSTSAGRWAAFVRPPYVPYAPALGNAGIHLDRLLIVDPSDIAHTLWAAEQIARSGAFALLVVWLSHTRKTHATPHQLRRLQLAAETGKTCAIVYRPAACRDIASPAALRIVLGTEKGRLRLDIVKSRGGRERHVSIEPAAFDHPQGVDWPAIPVAADVATDVAILHAPNPPTAADRARTSSTALSLETGIARVGHANASIMLPANVRELKRVAGAIRNS